MNNYFSYVFNFSVSYREGGLKRLTAYSNWFNENGGASFIVNKKLKGIEKKYPQNHYFFLSLNIFERVFSFSKKINEIILQIGSIDLYYSYGIPISKKFGAVNWFHLSNVLPLIKRNKLMSIKRQLELKFLGLLIKRSLKYADIISAESEYSLKLFENKWSNKLVVSINGNDDEINTFKNKELSNIDNIAITVGTIPYKCLDDVYKIFKFLQKDNPELVLMIIGIKDYIPAFILKDPLVTACGVLKQSEVCSLLKTSQYYITATMIENSYNAASEGGFLVKESFISDIGPHQELLKGMKFNKINHLNTRAPILHFKAEDIDDRNLKSWHQVIIEMLDLTNKKIYQDNLTQNN